jgi:hypothetical protein
MVWLTVMTLFPVSLLLLKFNRGRLQRREQTPLFVIVLALVIAGAVFAGNIVVDTATVGFVSLMSVNAPHVSIDLSIGTSQPIFSG